MDNIDSFVNILYNNHKSKKINVQEYTKKIKKIEETDSINMFFVIIAEIYNYFDKNLFKIKKIGTYSKEILIRKI